MRTLIVTSALLALAACNVSKDNNGVSVQYDQNTADKAAADVGNTAKDVANDIGSDVSKTGNKIQAKVRDKDDHSDHADNSAANTTENK